MQKIFATELNTAWDLVVSDGIGANLWDYSNAFQTSYTLTIMYEIFKFMRKFSVDVWRGVYFYLGNLAPRMSFWPYFLQLKPSSGVASKFASGTRNFAVHLGSPFLYGSWPRKWGARCSVQIVFFFIDLQMLMFDWVCMPMITKMPFFFYQTTIAYESRKDATNLQ